MNYIERGNRNSHSSDIDPQDLNNIRLKYLLQKEVGTAIYLRAEYQKMQALWTQIEENEEKRLLVELPQLSMTRMLVQDLHSKAMHEKNEDLRQEYVIRYMALQKEYDELSRRYNAGVEKFERRRMAFTRKMEKFNLEIDRHNQNLLQPANKINHFKRPGEYGE